MSVSDDKPASAKQTDTAPSALDRAIVLDLGKKKQKQIKRLRKGRGKLLDQVQGHLNELRAAGAMDANAQPVIVVVTAKRRNMAWM